MRELMIFSHKDHIGKLMIENEREIKGKKAIKNKHEKKRNNEEEQLQYGNVRCRAEQHFANKHITLHCGAANSLSRQSKAANEVYCKSAET